MSSRPVAGIPISSPLVSAAGGESLDDQVILGHHQLNGAVPVGQGRPEGSRSGAHAFTVRGDPERRIVVHEVVGEDAVDGAEVAFNEQRVDETCWFWW